MEVSDLLKQLQAYKRKYYVNKLMKGGIIAAAIILSYFLVINFLEYSIRFGSTMRSVLFFSFLAILIFVIIKYLFEPIYQLINNAKKLSDAEAARQIGQHFPQVDDKLLNTLQLYKESGSNDLIAAAIANKTANISSVPFVDAINLQENRQYLKYVLPPAAIILLLLMFVPQFFAESSNRIMKFNEDFAPIAPFSFELAEKDLQAFKNEDFDIKMRFEGNAIPQQAYLNIAGRRIKMSQDDNGLFTYRFEKLQDSKTFNFDAAGFESVTHSLKVVERPNLNNFNVFLDYPNYLQKASERISNIGNLQVPEGTQGRWSFEAKNTESLEIEWLSSEKVEKAVKKGQTFEFKKRLKSNDDYQVSLTNEFGTNRDPIQYSVSVVKDQYPEISVESFQDSTLFSYLILGGAVSDDYGLSKLEVHYEVEGGVKDKFQIKLQANNNQQSYYYQWDIDTMNISKGEKFSYFLQVWDNDGVNGHKSKKSSTYEFRVPSREEIKETLEKESTSTEKSIDKTLQKAKELKDQLEKVEDELKGKKEMDWQDKKALEEIIEKREELEKDIEKLKNANQKLNEQSKKFNQPNERLTDKIKQLEDLMNEVLDEDTKKLYEELQQLLDNQGDMEDIQENLDQLDQQEENMEKELERALEWFKQLKFESKVEETIEELEQLAEEQEKLAEETENKSADQEQLKEKQKEIEEKFEKIKEQTDEIQELNQELENPSLLDDFDSKEEAIEESMQDSQEKLDKKKNKKAGESQKKSSEQMKDMAKGMQQMQMSMEMESAQENLDNLENIVDNLVKISFQQEMLMSSMKEVKQSDPRFIELSQDQLKLKDDAKIIEDSLFALAERVFQIKTFVTREVGEMNDKMEESIELLKERKQSQATGKQQFAMTSMNNLALLLQDVLQQMQEQMADMKGSGMCKKPGESPGSQPKLSDLQKQLNQQIDGLKKSGKSGRQLSEELAKLAAEQEKIRQAMEEMAGKEEGMPGKDGAGDMKSLGEKMEETEIDLVNKKITRETIQRQEEIMTRLLETESALRERELDDERKGETAKELARTLPPAYEEYIKAKEKEIEQLKTVPPKLNLFYKKEVNAYFNRINGK